MFDARYFAFAALSALLVMTPGATFAVVVETALAEGRRAALMTVAGVGLANAIVAAAAAVGMAATFDRWPSALEAVRLGGGAYLAYLGLRGLWRARMRRDRPDAPHAGPDGQGRRAGAERPSEYVIRGVLTNLLNPPVLLFYMAVVPQFIGPHDPYLGRALVLGATHVAMSIVWQGSCGLAVGLAAEHLARPAVRQVLEGITGAVLVVLGARLLA